MIVLIVEDDPLTAAELTQAVRAYGHEVCSWADSADEAEWQAAQHQPDLVLMDFNLDGTKSGLNAAARIQANQRTVMVFVTGQLDPLVLSTIRDTQPFAVIEKPYTPEQIGHVLRQACTLH
jgi:CheY-like chemotaxis protein